MFGQTPQTGQNCPLATTEHCITALSTTEHCWPEMVLPNGAAVMARAWLSTSPGPESWQLATYWQDSPQLAGTGQGLEGLFRVYQGLAETGQELAKNSLDWPATSRD